MPTSKQLRQWLAGLTDCQQHVVDGSFGWNEPTRHAQVMMRVSAMGLAEGLSRSLTPRDDREWPERWLGVDAAAADAVETMLAGDELTEPAAHRALAAAYADGELVYTASSLPIRDQEAYAVGTDATVTFLCNRGANGIDGLVSSGIGAAAAAGRPAWVLTGDLGLFHDLNALALLREAPTPVRVVVFDNQGGGIFERLPQASEIDREEFEALFGTPSGLDVSRAAMLWGIPHRRAERPGDIAATAASGPELIEVRTDRRAGVALRKELERAATEAVAAALS